MDAEFIKQLATDVNNAIMAEVKPYQTRLKNFESKWTKLVEEKIKLERALDYAKNFIDGLGSARLKENLGRNGMDAVLKEINKIAGTETDICPICGDEKPIDDLHRNCGN